MTDTLSPLKSHDILFQCTYMFFKCSVYFWENDFKLCITWSFPSDFTAMMLQRIYKPFLFLFFYFKIHEYFYLNICFKANKLDINIIV